jgi:hypothetical protein
MPATALYRREVFEHVTGFDASVTECEDYDLNLRITRRFLVHCHEHVVADYRRHGSSTNRDLPGMLSAMTVARRQRHYVRRDEKRRAAYEAGICFCQDYFGAPLAREPATQLAAGEWRRSLPGIIVLARYHPRGLSPALQTPRQLHSPSEPSNGETHTGCARFRPMRDYLHTFAPAVRN